MDVFSSGGSIAGVIKGVDCDIVLPNSAFCLFAEYSSGSPPYYCTFMTNIAGIYQVPAGRTLKLLGLEWWGDTFTSGSDITVGYADTATAVGGSTSAPTNPVIFGGNSDDSKRILFTTASTPNISASNVRTLQGYTIAATKYPLFKMVGGNGDGNIRMWVTY